MTSVDNWTDVMYMCSIDYVRRSKDLINICIICLCTRVICLCTCKCLNSVTK